MKIETEYYTIETKEMNNIEIEGVNFFFNEWLKECDQEPCELYYQEGHLQTPETVYINQGEIIQRIGYVGGEKIIIESYNYNSKAYYYYWLTIQAEIERIKESLPCGFVVTR